MILTLTLAAGLLAAPEPQPEPQKGWVVEIRGYTYHDQAKPEGWIIEVRGFARHRKQAELPKSRMLQAPQPKLQIEPVESQYRADLPAFLKQWEGQIQVEAVETFYVDDLPAFFDQLQKR